ncbi:MAG: hypothetical protein ACMV0I_06370 [Pseudomonas sp.]
MVVVVVVVVVLGLGLGLGVSVGRCWWRRGGGVCVGVGVVVLTPC